MKRGVSIMTKLLRTLKANKSGASAAEYALIISLIALVIIAGAGLLGNAINDNYSGAAAQIKTTP
jgi:pilus assembly protein Flp/PilA